MTWRLAAIDEDLAGRLVSLTEAQLRAVAERLALLAVERSSIRDPAIVPALQALRERRFGDESTRSELESFVGTLDEVAWNLQDEVDAGRADASCHIDAFRRARSAMALWFALHPVPLNAAMEVAYEADAAIDDEKLLRREIEAAIEAERSRRI